MKTGRLRQSLPRPAFVYESTWDSLDYVRVMFNDYLGNYAGLGIVLLIIYLVVSLAMIGVFIWIMYSIIWRAVRRGMREFYAETDLPPSARFTSP